jgi:hypothetical protein
MSFVLVCAETATVCGRLLSVGEPFPTCRDLLDSHCGSLPCEIAMFLMFDWQLQQVWKADAEVLRQ